MFKSFPPNQKNGLSEKSGSLWYSSFSLKFQRFRHSSELVQICKNYAQSDRSGIFCGDGFWVRQDSKISHFLWFQCRFHDFDYGGWGRTRTLYLWGWLLEPLYSISIDRKMCDGNSHLMLNKSTSNRGKRKMLQSDKSLHKNVGSHLPDGFQHLPVGDVIL